MSAASISQPGMQLSHLLQQAVSEDVAISELQLDSRKVGPGGLFLAVKGETADARDYIGAAVAAGAVAVVADAGVSEFQKAAAVGVPVVEIEKLSERLGALASRFYGEPSQAMFLAGVTGTNGKTTTSRLAAQLLRANTEKCGVIGTLGAVVDDSIGEALNTTPDPVSLQAQLARWNSEGVSQVCMEVSSHSLVQGRVNSTRFDVAAFTNLSHDHLDYHGTMQTYAAAKAQLFEFESLSHMVVNADDDFANELRLRRPAGTELIDYSLVDPSAAVRVSQISHHVQGIRARVDSPWGSGWLNSPLPATFNLSNLLAAVSIACIRGVAFEQILDIVPSLRRVPGRMESIANQLGLHLVVDYCHTPDALLQVLRSLRKQAYGRLICVFGCGGDRDAEKRPLMGRVATECADRVIVTSDNPRSESAQQIVEHILAGCGSDVEVVLDRAQAIALAVSGAQPGDCILVAGKGPESYQQIGEEKLPFSDVQQLRLALACKSPEGAK